MQPYWTFFSNKFVGAVQSYFEDANSRYVDGSSLVGGDASGVDRRIAGYMAAKRDYKHYLSQLTQAGETIKFVSHSEGSAFAAGMAAYFAEQYQKDSNLPIVESSIYLSPDEMDEFSEFQTVDVDFGLSIRVHDDYDPVSPAFEDAGRVDVDIRTHGDKGGLTKSVQYAHGSTVSTRTINHLKQVLHQFVNNPNTKKNKMEILPLTLTSKVKGRLMIYISKSGIIFFALLLICSCQPKQIPLTAYENKAIAELVDSAKCKIVFEYDYEAVVRKEKMGDATLLFYNANELVCNADTILLKKIVKSSLKPILYKFRFIQNHETISVILQVPSKREPDADLCYKTVVYVLKSGQMHCH